MKPFLFFPGWLLTLCHPSADRCKTQRECLLEEYELSTLSTRLNTGRDRFGKAPQNHLGIVNKREVMSSF